MEYMSIPGPAPSVNSPFTKVGDADGELRHLEAALDVPLRVRHGLAVLGGEKVGELVHVCR